MAPFLSVDPALERRIREIGDQLLARMDASPAPGIFSKKGVAARLMEWSLKDPVFKSQLFRFVDVLPTLQSGREIVRHLQEAEAELGATRHRHESLEQLAVQAVERTNRFSTLEVIPVLMPLHHTIRPGVGRSYRPPVPR